MDRNLKVLLAGTLLTGASISAMMQMSPVQAVMLQASYTDTGLLTGFARNIVYVFLSPMTAVIILRINWNKPLPLSAVLLAVSHTLMWLADNLLMVMAAQLVMGAAMFFFFPCGESIIATSYEKTHRFRAFSVFVSAITGGFLLGSLLAGIVAFLAGLKLLFASMVVVSIMASLVFTRLKIANNTFEEEKNISLKTLAKPIVLAIPYYFVLSSAYSVLPGFLVLNGFTEFEVGVLFFFHMLSRMSISYFLSKAGSGIAKQLLIGSSVILGVSCLLASIHPASFTAYLLFLVFLGLSVSVSYIATLQAVSKRGGPRSIFLIGVFETFIGVSFIVGPPLAGFLLDAYGMSITLQALAAAVALAVALNLLHRYQL
ncbi:MAG: MFS transporter [Candidatus Caldarchaeum sp.]